jgi:hypothetical protein
LLEVLGGGADDTDIAFAFAELHRRAERMIGPYPFAFTRLGIELKDVDPAPYALLLLTSGLARDFVEVAEPDAASIALERFVASSISALLGPQGRVIRFGYPPEGARPAQFRDAVQWLGVQMGARTMPLIGADLRRADGGIDVVGWVAHSDRFGPGPVLAVQVTFDQDLRSKSLEIAGSDFNRWYRLAAPVAVLASPLDGASDPDLMLELMGRVVLLDRWRLLAAFQSPPAFPAVSAEWVSTVISDMEI